MSSPLSLPVQKLVIGRSGDRCALPTCRKRLSLDATTTDGPSIIGELAHIKGERSDAARYDPFQPEPERNAAHNLIYICRNCHRQIDQQPGTYSVEHLTKIKADHEAWVLDTFLRQTVNITFVELESVCKAIAGQPTGTQTSLELTPLLDKLDRNGLTSAVHQRLSVGLTLERLVSTYINHVAKIDTSFPKRLKNGFSEEYNRLRSMGFSGDPLFFALAEFASSGGENNLERQVAGLAVLAHLFAICEVFER